MAKPTTRQELKDYAYRQLGAPVLEINVDDDQADDLMDDAIQFFNERHYNGVEKMYLKHELTQEDLNVFISGLNLTDEIKNELNKITIYNY